VTKRVAEVEMRAVISFEGIDLHDARLDRDVMPDQLRQERDVQRQRAIDRSLEAQESILVANQRMLDALGQAVAKLIGRQGLEQIRIDQHRARLVEGSDQ